MSLSNHSKYFRYSLKILVLCILIATPTIDSFTVPSTNNNNNGCFHANLNTCQKTGFHRELFTRLQSNSDKLLDDFRLSSGEIIDPYGTLKISNKADHKDIKNAYYTLAKKYHPDKAKLRGILPGRCNNLDEVRDEWDKIKFAYEILTDKKKRARYDRNSAISDPSSAMGRAALDFFGWGLQGVGKGMFEVGKGFAKVGEDVLSSSSSSSSSSSNGNKAFNDTATENGNW